MVFVFIGQRKKVKIVSELFLLWFNLTYLAKIHSSICREISNLDLKMLFTTKTNKGKRRWRTLYFFFIFFSEEIVQIWKTHKRGGVADAPYTMSNLWMWQKCNWLMDKRVKSFSSIPAVPYPEQALLASLPIRQRSYLFLYYLYCKCDNQIVYPWKLQFMFFNWSQIDTPT